MRKAAAYFFLMLLMQNASGAAAQEYDIKQMTPEIQQAFAGRQSRHQEIESMKAAGRLGENNHGYVQGLDNSTTLEDLVRAENQSRRVIYNAIVDQNGLGPNGLVQVEAVFAGVKRDKARPGDSIQLPSGEWTQK